MDIFPMKKKKTIAQKLTIKCSYTALNKIKCVIVEMFSINM